MATTRAHPTRLRYAAALTASAALAVAGLAPASLAAAGGPGHRVKSASVAWAWSSHVW